jgi:hypothetical protein
MADIDLTGSTVNLVVLEKKITEIGLSQQALLAALYNLTQAVYAICNNLDEDSGTLGTDYLAKIGTPLATAQRTSGIAKPHGDTTEA